MRATSSRRLRSRAYGFRGRLAQTSPLQLGEVRERATGGAFGADFGDHNPVAFVKEILENILQLRRGVGAVQRPLVGQPGTGLAGEQPGTERGIVGGRY